eukprot:NODE_2015_length_849_cov_286.981250_g1413_i0.p1 GENE.NODE_2015_length_849_cov_286.981250_g1413_i0~~NODE_2015_length_849_cov_286.981250_g1413_i0.p1  ORF type:complete len:149 (-),score=30.78 NODE_2015_length_849_cov_286.981250_g1413_i0:319-765(-)
MVWTESQFQVQNAKDTRRVLVAPSAVLFENGLNGNWHVFVKKDQKLPSVTTRELKTAQDQSTVPLRIFVGNSTAPEDRKYLENVGFMGITGFTVGAPTTLDLTVAVDNDGVMTMSAIDGETGKPLSIGPNHLKKVTRKIFEPTYKTIR